MELSFSARQLQQFSYQAYANRHAGRHRTGDLLLYHSQQLIGYNKELEIQTGNLDFPP
jgi:hypothetical protein